MQKYFQYGQKTGIVIGIGCGAGIGIGPGFGNIGKDEVIFGMYSPS